MYLLLAIPFHHHPIGSFCVLSGHKVIGAADLLHQHGGEVQFLFDLSGYGVRIRSLNEEEGEIELSLMKSIDLSVRRRKEAIEIEIDLSMKKVKAR